MAKASKAAPKAKADPKAFLRAAETFKQASDGTRLRVLLALKGGERNVTELLAELDGPSQPALSHHISIMKLSGLISPRRQGKNNYYALTPKGESLAVAAGAMI